MTFLFLIMTVMGVGSAWAQTHTEKYDYDGDGVDETYNVVYLKLGGATGTKDGSSAANAVGSWANAYSKLPDYTGTTDDDRDAAWDSNIIVVCDAQGKANLFINETTSGNRPATITGVWPWDAEHTTADYVKTNGGRVFLNGNTAHANTIGTATFTSGTTRIGADTKFKYIRFGGGQYSMLSMYLHDAYFDVGCLTYEITYDLTEANGATSGRTAPDMQLFMFANAYSFDKSKTDGGFNSLMRPVTLTIRSGKFGRILSNRVAGDVTTRFVIANPSKPLLCTINIDIDPNTTTGEWNPENNPDDISFIAAGMTQGTEFCDVEFNIKRGKIATFVGAMQGTNITNADAANLSASTFIGRTVVNIKPDNDDDVVIQRYFAGCQGRYTSGQTTIANVAFYGKSTLNMYGGKIVGGAFLSGGGVSGLKYTDSKGTTYHTTDKFIPYLDNTVSKNYPFMGIKYQMYKADGVLPTLTNMKNGETLDISTTETHFNIYGGEISGGLYGGSYGEAPQLTADYAIESAGSHWGNTYINIYGGKISGGVYGGGYGTTRYYNEATKDKEKFLTVAQLYGNTNVNIYGGDISGGIYGGGKGVNAQAANQKITINTYNGTSSSTKTVTTVANEFTDIAKVYGNTKVTINPTDPNWEYTGDIYGGGALGSVEGKTKVIIKGGKITGNVFGAGEGESGHPNKAKVEGTDNIVTVNIENGAISENVYGGGNLAVAKANPTINISGGAISQNVYGGGYGAPAVLTGNTTINVAGGSITKDVYGGGALANITGSTAINVSGGTVAQDVYGGGALANVSANTSVNLTGGTIRDSYGGGLGSADVAALIGGDATTTLNGSIVLGNVFGCNNLNGTPQGHAKVHVLSTAERDGQGAEEYDVAAVYGGGNEAAYVPTDGNDFAEVLIENCDNSIEYVYGGGNAAPVPATKVTIVGANAIDNAFAGGNGAGADNPGADIGYKGFFSKGAVTEYGTGIATINVQGGTIHHVYGGSNTLGYIKDHAVVNVNAAGTCPMDVAELYGGGKMAPGKAATINITCTGEGKIDNVYGGAHMADLTGDITLNINGGNIGNAFGGNNESGTIDGTITVNVNWDEDACATNSLTNVYGGGNLAPYTTPDGLVGPTVNLINGTVTQSVFGGGYGVGAVVTGNPEVNVTGGSAANIYGGGALADVSGNTSVVISGGTSGDVYGGGLGSAEVAASVGNTSVSVTGGTANNVFGCNNTNGSPTGTVNVEIAGGTVNNNVFGGGNLAAATVNPIVTVSGGTVTHDVYGGGALADVNGNTTVNLTGGAVGGAYGGALGQKNGVNGATEDIAAYVNGNTTVTLNGTQITETGVFGCNNLNGTPKGHAYVHVLSTTPRDGEDYDVPAVYGGGNHAAYQPENKDEYAEVLIENCDNSIDYVYGGGNAAPVPATKVTIYGADAINHAFAGGNGAGQSEDPDAPNYNPGADVGFKGYYSQGSREEYGTGTAQITVYGGTVNNVYGGSNTLGYIRTSTKVEIDDVPDDYEGNHCTLNVGTVHGGGNEAELFCPTEVILGCSDGADVIFGGANNADINGDVTMTLRSGTYGKVFGGNNQGGCVKGKITINIDETGCEPVMIGELYCCGSYAPYSVYGYNDDGTCKTSGTALYDDPEINLISFTRIGKVFGGGLGEKATLYGNTHVNVNPITGIFAGNDVQPIYVLDENDERKSTSAATTLPLGVTRKNDTTIHIANEVGSIGSIYGGGNAGAVYGNTNVKIACDMDKNKHVSGADTTTEKDVAVNITGNVFGGGNEAIVSGNTNVTIGKE